MTVKRDKWMAASIIAIPLTFIGVCMAFDSDPIPPPASVPVSPPIVVQTENPEVIKQLGELVKLFARMQTEIEAIKAGEQPVESPGTLRLIDPQTGIEIQTNRKRIVRVVGKEVKFITIWENGKWNDVDALWGAENIPAPSMEISRGGNISRVEFPPRQPRGDDE